MIETKNDISNVLRKQRIFRLSLAYDKLLKNQTFRIGREWPIKFFALLSTMFTALLNFVLFIRNSAFFTRNSVLGSLHLKKGRIVSTVSTFSILLAVRTSDIFLLLDAPAIGCWVFSQLGLLTLSCSTYNRYCSNDWALSRRFLLSNFRFERISLFSFLIDWHAD